MTQAERQKMYRERKKRQLGEVYLQRERERMARNRRRKREHERERTWKTNPEYCTTQALAAAYVSTHDDKKPLAISANDYYATKAWLT